MLYSQSLHGAFLCPFSKQFGPGPQKYLVNELRGIWQARFYIPVLKPWHLNTFESDPSLEINNNNENFWIFSHWKTNIWPFWDPTQLFSDRHSPWASATSPLRSSICTQDSVKLQLQASIVSKVLLLLLAVIFLPNPHPELSHLIILTGHLSPFYWQYFSS